MEEWRNIEGFANYQVSNLGNVRSSRKVLVKTLDKYGYHTVSLHNTNGMKVCKVHRLVFLPDYDDNLQVNHKDEVKTNNQVNNLEMCTNRYNCNYGSSRTALISTCCRGQIKDWHTGNTYPVHSAYNFRWRYKL